MSKSKKPSFKILGQITSVDVTHHFPGRSLRVVSIFHRPMLLMVLDEHGLKAIVPKRSRR